MRTFLRTSLLASCILGQVDLQVKAQPGSLDTTFNVADGGFGQGDGATQGPVNACLVQPDGKILIGGAFIPYNTMVGRGFNRLNADGSLDATFQVGTGVVGTVHCIALQPDGKILLAGVFGTYNGTPRSNIARLNTDGSVDTGFDPGTGPSSAVYSMAVQPDGKIIIGGAFSTYNGTARSRIARLNANGSLDASFNPGTGATGSVGNLGILSVVHQPDGKILIAGDFSSYNGTARNRIARLNGDGTLDTGFNPGTGSANPLRSIALQVDGKIIVGGDFTFFNGTARNRIARLSSTGSVDTGFDPGLGVEGAFGAVHTIALRPDGRLLIAGWITTYNGVVRNRIASLTSTGALDTGFDPGAGANQTIRCTALQTDGKVIIGGDFIYFGGRGSGRLARAHVDGTPDIGFNVAGGANDQVLITAVQPDGKVLFGGNFTSYYGTISDRVTRTNSDGSIDASFNLALTDPQTIYDIDVQPDGKIVLSGFSDSFNGYIARFNADGSADPSFDPGNGPGGTNSRITSTAVQADGKLIIVGFFNSYNGTALNNIARLNADGSLDPTFNTGTGTSSTLESVSVQPDGKIIIGGGFTSYNGTACNNIARLNASGGLDASFNPGTGPNSTVVCTALRPDGKIVIGGAFTSVNGTMCNRIARLNSDGSLDTGFNPGTGAGAIVQSMILQPDGMIVIAGSFTTMNGVSRNHLARLNANGGLDNAFDPGTGANSTIRSVALQADGKILIGGSFTGYNGTGRNRIARVNGTPCVGITLMLEGPYSGSLMNDALRSLPSFPLTEPFTSMGYAGIGYVGGATIGSSVRTTTGNNAIVDWLLVEMRPVATPGTISASRAVLVQRDGDVVDLDGSSAVGFSGLPSGNYCVAVRSRNHLPVMSSPTVPVNYGTGAAAVDFTLPSTLVYDNDARRNVGGTMVLAAGDVNGNGTVQYAGGGNDRDLVLARIGGIIPTNTVNGYFPEDVNMDGMVSYTGAANDRDVILQSIGGIVPTNTRMALLP
ncbi:MAG TPA: hypothetical protein PLB89_13215 [Flavobacteriales bacterium]|nr:hypothetical protein [Flavobacteriales bacterium]